MKLLTLSLSLLLLGAEPTVADSPAKDLTCEAAGHSFVLDAVDFQALDDLGVTPEIFRNYPANSKKRAQVCWTRHVARLIIAHKVTSQDVTDNPLFVIVGLSNEEADKLSDIQASWIADALIARKNKTGTYGPGKDAH